MAADKISYHKAAAEYLRHYYEEHADSTIFSMYHFISQLATEAKHIAKSLGLKDMEYQNAIVATWFRYAGLTELGQGQTEDMKKILLDFFTLVAYPDDERLIVQNAISTVAEGKFAASKIEQTVSDAVYSQLVQPNMLENVLLIKDELNRINRVEKPELLYMKFFMEMFIKTRFYTPFAAAEYLQPREKNFQLLEKRIHKLEETKIVEPVKSKADGSPSLSNKETEDLFKIAFRNYNHLISVADSKASLLINVNSIIISVMIAFVLSKAEKSMFLLWPTIVLLTVCLSTILLSILASRPQNNSFLEDRKSHSYQRFFFGSFDLVDPNFLHVQWEEYYAQLMELFSSAKEQVYLEVYKESYNVRKVLSKKFNYLAYAYWVFIVGLLISVIAFVIAIYSQAKS